MIDHWLLPEGIEEALPPQAARLESLRRELLDLFYRWGYDLVMPPLVEYLESLLTGMGHDLDLQTFKITDQLTGRLMGVRADMTPQVARIDAHHLKREHPVRLCYLGTVLRTRSDGFGRSRSPLQVGAELYGHAGIASDVEVLCLMLEMLKATGISQVHLDLGHVGIYRALVREAGLTPEQEGPLFDALQRKARPELEAMIQALALSPEQRDQLNSLADLNGGKEVLAAAEACLAGAGRELLKALSELRDIASAVSAKFPELPLHFDLAELRGYHYHTGAVFAAYVPGHGQAIAQGGRYDDVGRVFGHARPATGFSADLKTLTALSTALPLAQTRGILSPGSDDSTLESAVATLRKQGERVITQLPQQSGTAHDMGCDRLLVKHNNEWIVIDG